MNVELEKNRKPRDSGDCRSGFGRDFFPRGAAVWIPVALFVSLVLFQKDKSKRLKMIHRLRRLTQMRERKLEGKWQGSPR